jgi:hypothetical protein
MILSLIAVYVIGFFGFSIQAGMDERDPGSAVLGATLWPLIVVIMIVQLPYSVTYRIRTGEWP